MTDREMHVIESPSQAAPVGANFVRQNPSTTGGLLVSKSGLNVKYDITSTGLIDMGYRGTIHVKLYNHGEEDYFVAKGDKISQLVVVHVMPVSLQIVDELDPSERGARGFGSSGK